MLEVKLNLENSGIDMQEILSYRQEVENIHKNLHERVNDESDFVGWLDLPTHYDKVEFKKIKEAAKRINEDSDILLVIRNWWFISRSKSSNRSSY